MLLNMMLTVIYVSSVPISLQEQLVWQTWVSIFLVFLSFMVNLNFWRHFCSLKSSTSPYLSWCLQVAGSTPPSLYPPHPHATPCHPRTQFSLESTINFNRLNKDCHRELWLAGNHLVKIFCHLSVYRWRGQKNLPWLSLWWRFVALRCDEDLNHFLRQWTTCLVDLKADRIAATNLRSRVCGNALLNTTGLVVATWGHGSK